MIDRIQYSNKVYIPIVLSGLIAVASSIALGILARNGWQTAMVQNNICMLTLMTIGGTSFIFFCISTVQKNKYDEFKKIQKELLYKRVEAFLSVEPFVGNDSLHPFARLTDVVKGLICQYTGLIENTFLRQEFGLINQAARDELCKAQMARFGDMPRENILKGFFRLCEDSSELGEMARDELDHITDPLYRVLHWENLEIGCKFRIIRHCSTGFAIAIGLLLYYKERKIQPETMTAIYKTNPNDNSPSSIPGLYFLLWFTVNQDNPLLIDLMFDCFDGISYQNLDPSWILFTFASDNVSEKTALFLLSKGVNIMRFHLMMFPLLGWVTALKWLKENNLDELKRIIKASERFGKTFINLAVAGAISKKQPKATNIAFPILDLLRIFILSLK